VAGGPGVRPTERLDPAVDADSRRFRTNWVSNGRDAPGRNRTTSPGAMSRWRSDGRLRTSCQEIQIGVSDVIHPQNDERPRGAAAAHFPLRHHDAP
jgi:hypothetical protein